MSTHQKKICILIAGGTVQHTERGNLLGIKKQADIAPWIESMPELRLIARDLEAHLLHGGEDAEVSPHVWALGARFIYERRNDFNGFVVLASIDNIPYFANALSLMLKNIPFPIVFTGSQLPDYLLDDASGLAALLQESEDVGIRANIVNAIHAVRQQFAGVFVLFGGVFVHGRYIHLKQPLSHMPFSYQPSRVLGKVEFSTKVALEYANAMQDFKQEGEMSLDDRVEARVRLFFFSPSFNVFNISEDLKDARGAVFCLPSTVSYPTDLLGELAKKTPRIPAVFYAKSFILPKKGPPPPLLKKLEDAGVIVVTEKNIPEMLVAFMCALGRTDDIRAIKQMLLS